MAKAKALPTKSVRTPLEAATALRSGRLMVIDAPEVEPPDKSPPTLVKSILNVLNGPRDSIERLAFEQDPSQNNIYGALYRTKTRLIPDSMLKRIAIQDDLVAAIINARCQMLSAFGRLQPDRFSMGFKIEPKTAVLDKCTPQEKDAIQKRIARFAEKVQTCGNTKGWSDQDRMTFAQYLSMQTRNALVVGRFATEVIYVLDPAEGKNKFHSFRPIDAGTIYRAAPQKEAAQSVRDSARGLLEALKNKHLEPERFEADHYAWVQVIEGQPVQAFTSEECLVHNVYPVTDYELQGYPLTPLDTVIQAVTTHINITRHNRLYFEHGRASRGIIVIKSEDVDEGVISKMRQAMQAAITGVNNWWRMPVFGFGKDEDIQFQPTDQGQRDMEFQFLSDSNARVILSAFQMSPEELPGYAHLSRGTNNQSLSESNNEYKLEAHRDVGIRPLIAQIQDFIDSCLFPLMDEELSKLCTFRLIGLDAETAEKESVRIQQDLALHLTYDEVLETVEKPPVGRLLGGEFPLNQQYQAVLDKYVPVGVILEHLFGIKGASKDPQFQYLRDPFWMQMHQEQVQMQMQQQQMQMQQQQAAQGQGQPPGKGGDKPAEGKGEPEGASGGDEKGKAPPSEGSAPEGEGSDLTRSIDQLVGMLSKSESQLPQSKRALLARQRKLLSTVMGAWENESRATIDEIVDVALKHAPTPKG